MFVIGPRAERKRLIRESVTPKKGREKLVQLAEGKNKYLYGTTCPDQSSYTALETVATVSMQIAANEAKYVSGHSDIPVAIDGTWQKHGPTSLNGAVIVTSFYTGKVLDASILSRFCKCPNKMHNEN
ncbi:hypothetical protein TNCV_3062411 [Trichonephila clavipes]|nr:hypothetical protein TNCV_3062411 [Trichonephila clavipes]